METARSELIGKALDRDLADGEAVEAAIDHFIAQRHDRSSSVAHSPGVRSAGG
jgi:hypothetical protein